MSKAIARIKAIRATKLGWLTLLAAVLAASGLGVASASYGKVARPDKTFKIGFFVYSYANTYSQAELKAAKKHAAKLGASIQFFDGKFDGPNQVSQIQDAIASGQYDGFIINANDGNAVVQPIKQAIARKIKVICLIEPCGPNRLTQKPQIPGLTVQMGYSAAEEGRILSSLFIKGCRKYRPQNQRCEIALLPGSTTIPIDSTRVKSVRAAIKSHPNIKLVAVQPGGFLQEPAYRAVKNILQAHPNLAVVGSGGDQMTLGAEQAVKEAGRLGKVGLIGTAATIEGIARVRSGRWLGDTIWLPVSESKKAVEFMLAALNGKKVPSSFNDRSLSPIGPIATQENLRKSNFKGEWHA